MAISHLYPTQRPALDLNFARQKRLDSRVTFTRGSTATYVGSDGLIKTAANHEARFDHDPVTGESLGLLVEENRTNFIRYSEEVDNNSVWAKVGTTISANTTTAPDGTTTADTVTPSSGNGFKDLYQSFYSSASANTAYTFSVFVKANGIQYFTVVPYYNGGSYPSWFDLSAGTVLTERSGNTSTITAYPNGWYRCTVTRTTPDPLTNALFIVRPADADNNATYTGDGSSGFYVWGFQVERGSFPTSYIPTSGSTVTRSDDLASMTGTNFTSWFNHTESTMYTEGVFIGDPYSGNHGYLSTFDVGANDSSFYSRIRLLDSNDTIVFQSTLPSVATTTGDIILSIGANAKNTVIKQVHAITNSVSASAAINGTLGTNTISGSIQVPDRLQLGRHGQAYKTTCHLRRFAYYPTRLTDTQLQALTL